MRQLTKAVIAMALVALLAVGLAIAKDERQGMAQNVDIYELYNDLPIIFWRIEQQNYQAVETLLRAGADIETRGFFGMTPIIWAAAAGDWIMVKFLIERGADPSAYAGNGMTVADLALNSRVVLDSPYGEALQEVRGILAERGLYNDIPTSAELRARMDAGTLKRPPYFDEWRATYWPPEANARADNVRAQQ